jgi:hypothetical protein
MKILIDKLLFSKLSIEELYDKIIQKISTIAI